MSKSMIDPLNTFPSSAIPEFCNLIKLFKYTLTETIENLAEDSKRPDFEKIKARLQNEMQWFSNNIANWRTIKLSTQEKTGLEALQAEHEEAKELLSIIEKKLRLH